MWRSSFSLIHNALRQRCQRLQEEPLDDACHGPLQPIQFKNLGSRNEHGATAIRTISFSILLILILASLWAVMFRVDLTPQVEDDFFFSTEDQAFRDSQEIAEQFPSKEQLILSIRSDDRLSSETLSEIDDLSKSSRISRRSRRYRA